MQKKVLFALMALLSCLTTWAQVSVPTTADELLAAFEQGKSQVQLGADIVLTGDQQVVVPAGETITLDLNNHTLSHSGPSAVNTGVVRVQFGGTLTVNGPGKISGGEFRSVGIFLGQKASSQGSLTEPPVATLTVNGGTIEGLFYGISGNGTVPGATWYGATDVTINGGTIQSTWDGVSVKPTGMSSEKGVGIFQPQVNGTMTITDGIIRGYNAGVEVRGGTVNIEGGKLIAISDAYSTEPNGNGPTTTGAALAVAQHTHDAAVEVAISGGILEGEKALSVTNPNNRPNVNDVEEVSVSLTGGKLKGNVWINDYRVNPLPLLTALTNQAVEYDGLLTAALASADPIVYNFGKYITPALVVAFGGAAIPPTSGTEGYTVVYLDAEGNLVEMLNPNLDPGQDPEYIPAEGVINAGDYTAVVRYNSDMIGVPFTVVPFTLSNENTTVTNGWIARPTYNGEEQEITPENFENTIKVDDGTDNDDHIHVLTADDIENFDVTADADVDFINSNEFEQKVINVAGADNFDGSFDTYFQIRRIVLKANDFTISDEELTYNGEVQRPAVTPKSATALFTVADAANADDDTDIIVEAAEGYDNTSAGNQAYQIKTTNKGKQNFVTTAAANTPIEGEYEIERYLLTAENFNLSDDEFTFNGNTQVPEVSLVPRLGYPALPTGATVEAAAVVVMPDPSINVDDYTITIQNLEAETRNFSVGAFEEEEFVEGDVTKQYSIVLNDDDQSFVATITDPGFKYNGLPQTLTDDDDKNPGIVVMDRTINGAPEG